MELELENKKETKIQSPQDTYEVMKKIFFDRHQDVDLLKEHFWVISLNRGAKILSIELVSMGTNGRTLANPPEVFRVPLYKVASHIVLVHNHPSGTIKPSESDLDITNRLIQVGMMMDIQVLDHVIVTKHSYYSFEDHGLIEKLKWDKKYGLTFVWEKELKRISEKEGMKKGIKKGLQQGEKNKQIEIAKIAKQMLAKKMDLKLIQELTGLSPQWLGRLKNELEDQKEQEK